MPGKGASEMKGRRGLAASLSYDQLYQVVKASLSYWRPGTNCPRWTSIIEKS